MNISDLLNLKQNFKRFTQEHQDIKELKDLVKQRGFYAGQKLGITFDYPEGDKFQYTIELSDEDVDFLNKIF